MLTTVSHSVVCQLISVIARKWECKICSIDVFPTKRRFQINLKANQREPSRSGGKGVQFLAGGRYNIFGAGRVRIPLHISYVPRPSLRKKTRNFQRRFKIDDKQASTTAVPLISRCYETRKGLTRRGPRPWTTGLYSSGEKQCQNIGDGAK